VLCSLQRYGINVADGSWLVLLAKWTMQGFGPRNFLIFFFSKAG
jgi:hypothetical protein